MASSTKVAVIGCGYWGKNLVRNFHDFQGLSTVCDMTEAGRKTVEQLAPNAYIVNQVEKVLDDIKIQGVAIATPVETHFELVKSEPLAGKALSFVHPSAYVDQPCSIGPGVKIWHFCHIMPHAQIGRNSNLGQNVFVASGVVIGENVKIQNNVSVYTGVESEDDVFCGSSCVFTNVINPRSQITRQGEYQKTLVKQGATTLLKTL